MKYDTAYKRQKRKYSFWTQIFFSLFVAVGFVLGGIVLSFNAIYIYYPIEGKSMLPTINNGTKDGVYVNRYNKGARGDIVVVETPPSSEDYNVIKRLIALGGDKVAIIHNEMGYFIYLIPKGEKKPYVLTEDYISEENRKTGMRITYDNFYALMKNSSNKFSSIDGINYLTVPDNYVFYLGDNRAISNDCSKYGPVIASKIIGNAEIIIKDEKDGFSQVINYFNEKIGRIFS